MTHWAGGRRFRMEVLEDLALGRRVKARGFAQRVALGLDLVGVRWARGAFGVVENLTKNLFALFHFRPELLLGFVCGLAMFTLFPLAACLAGRALWWPTGIMLIALFLAYQQMGRYQHFSAAQMPLYPAAALLLVYALLRSMCLALWRGGVTWRGTFYSLQELRRQSEERKLALQPFTSSKGWVPHISPDFSRRCRDYRGHCVLGYLRRSGIAGTLGEREPT